MKAIYHIKASLLALAAMVACTEFETLDESHNPLDNGLIQELSITGKDFIFDGETRSSVTIGESGASFTWDEDDVIGIFPDKGDQVSFAMDEGAGTQTATFSGGGWALKSSSTYAAYYPHVYENRDMTAIPVSYVGQTQNGNGNTDHIGAYDFMAAGVSTPENGAVAFDMQHLGALVQLTITVPEPSTLTKMVLTSSTEFTETGTTDLTAETPAIIADTQSNTFEIALNDIATTEANENVTVYFMTAPVDLTDSELTIIAHFADESTCEVELTGKNLQAGKAYKLSAELKETIPNNQIWYTSSDGNVVIPYNTSAFGTNIESNIYTNGKGIITFKENIITIGDHAFYNCQQLESIEMPNSVISIMDYAFYECNLQYLNLHDGITSIGRNSFCGNPLKTITLPNGITTIQAYTFANCDSLEEVIIPNNVSTIEQYAFFRCYSLRSFIIPEGVTSVCNHAFYDNELTKITLPETIKEIGQVAFGKNPYLQHITIKAEEPPTAYANSFDANSCTSGVLYVPSGSLESYKTASVWSDFKRIYGE